MYLTKWDPFETLANLEDDMGRIFDRHRSLNQNKSTNLRASWLPVVDIHEDPEGFYFDMEAPGLNKENFDVHVEDGVLSIKGERKSINEDKAKNYHRVEREYGTFARSFSLPETADTEKVNAEYVNGILHIKIGKKEAAKPKKIDVSVK
ncbi:MAG: Hsp20/alpha crystallin family protein [Deltaproteobacteria bacterium]|nr:Hsp20/alpha crystallin family protein [Deltaproteobacteria bacterium]